LALLSKMVFLDLGFSEMGEIVKSALQT
jgi:hypothetical protein